MVFIVLGFNEECLLSLMRKRESLQLIWKIVRLKEIKMLIMLVLSEWDKFIAMLRLQSRQSSRIMCWLIHQ